MRRNKPPFRADFVGSFLRPQPLKEARAAKAAGKISDEELRAVEDREIIRLIGRLEDIGLQDVTDGEFRRTTWHHDFFIGLDGVEMKEAVGRNHFHGVSAAPRAAMLTGKIGFTSHPMIEHFKFLKANTKVTPKITIPSPSMLHFRRTAADIRAIYPNTDEFFADLAATYDKVIRAFHDVGCRYLQLDDTIWANMCSEDQRNQARERGHDTDDLQRRYAACINEALALKPTDMTITMHSCRGNFRSDWIASGGYEPVAEVMLNDLNIDGYFLEYDTDRAGGFEPLRFLPKGNKVVVLGLVSSKFGALEDKDTIKRRIEAATEYADLDQLCLSPQCGFASSEEGNILTEDEQFAKLAMIVDVAREIWG